MTPEAKKICFKCLSDDAAKRYAAIGQSYKPDAFKRWLNALYHHHFYPCFYASNLAMKIYGLSSPYEARYKRLVFDKKTHAGIYVACVKYSGCLTIIPDECPFHLEHLLAAQYIR